MKNTQKTLLFIWQKMKPYRFGFLVAFILYGLLVLIRNVVVPVYVSKVTDFLNINNFQGAYGAVFILLGIYFVARTAGFFSMHILAKKESLLSRDLDDFSYQHFTKHEYHFYKNQFTGSLVDKAKRLGRNTVNIIDNFLFNIFSVVVAIVGIFWVLFQEHIIIGLAFLVFLLVYGFLLWWMSKKMAPVYEERSIAKSKFSGILSDILTNIQTVLFFENKETDKKLFEKANNNFHEKRYRAWKLSINYQDIIAFLPTLFTGGVTLYAVSLAESGALSVGSVILIFLLSNNLNRQMWFLSRSAKMFTSDISDLAESIEIIERTPAVLDSLDSKNCTISQGDISFNNISFTYPNGEHVFDNFNLSIPAGQSVGIVGKSGSGKTTITKLLLRLYDIESGEITIDGQNIAEITQYDLRNTIAYIPQETILFHRTIYENIAYGKPDASEKEILSVSESAHVDEFVQRLEHQYKTKVGERGVKLSGGQRQRIGIARAMLRSNAPILMLDEATSSLDSKSEHYIQESFNRLSHNRTTIVVAHRLSTIQNLDRIIVMEHGKIIEDGSHDELIQEQGYYAELWKVQNNTVSLD